MVWYEWGLWFFFNRGIVGSLYIILFYLFFKLWCWGSFGYEYNGFGFLSLDKWIDDKLFRWSVGCKGICFVVDINENWWIRGMLRGNVYSGCGFC